MARLRRAAQFSGANAFPPGRSAGYTHPSPARAAMSESLDPAFIARRLVELRTEHRDLDVAIASLADDSSADEIQLRRLKKRKLRIRDMITYYENKLIPDEPA
jgi:hypothetical protein